MIRVGLTGTLGAGKSTVGRMFEDWGAYRIDADELARQAVTPGQPAYDRIVSTWGARVLGADGALNRRVVRGIAFSDPEARRKLEAIVHPEVAKRREALLRDAAERGVEIVVEEIPLLFEVGMRNAFDVVIAVDAAPPLRRARVEAARGMSSEEFDAVEAAQLPAAEKCRLADQVLRNDGTPRELEVRARRVWDRLTETGAGAGEPGSGTESTPTGVEGEDPASTGPHSVRWAVDLHLHTTASRDCLSSPEAVVRAALQAGLDRIAVTDHDEIEGAWAARELAPERVIVGEEVRTSEGLDLIGLFLDEHISPGGSFREVAAEIRRQGGVVYLPHPFDSRRGSSRRFLDGVADCIDVVEGLNARIHVRERNVRAEEWACGQGLPVAAGSDAHLLSEIGRARTLLPAFDGPESFLRAVAKSVLVGGSSGRWVHLGSTWAKLRKRLAPSRPPATTFLTGRRGGK
ncbi:MAG: dephospho-CoA kinase [Gemmatimonadota bacterium]